MSKKILILIIFVSIFTIFLGILSTDGNSVSLAAEPSKLIKNPLGTTSIPTLIGRIIKAILGIVGSIALLMFIYGGFLWMTARGEAKQVEKGKDTLVWATIGLATIFFAYAAVNFVIKAMTGGGEEKGTSSQSALNICVCKENPYDGFWVEYNLPQGSCVDSSQDNRYDCRWISGACVKDDKYYLGVASKEQCESIGYVWEGIEQ
jgi:amino acid transporter